MDLMTDRRNGETALGHVRWLAGGTGTGKSTVAAALAERYGVRVYDGDRAEHRWRARCTPDHHPHMYATWNGPSGAMWADRSPREIFQSMASLYGETVGFVAEDLAAMPADRVIVVDYFGVLPGHLAPLLHRPDHAAFLLPTSDFRARVLRERYADPARARANWGDHDLETVLAKRLARDALWDDEVRHQARTHGLRVTTVDGRTTIDDLTRRLATRFGLDRADR
ncbi:hypothetical protein Airi01_031570 [Actinoallomurus iriomotensis]|uniref:Uncharacterized protein n=2 Tax=Actinoallomurus iriomotensis TaxID=478107 RepID=A0A9W6RJ76_9ACTN|nr:hypothetical protein Airi01_031570 [Actinoallomurus iriomotensis]